MSILDAYEQEFNALSTDKEKYMEELKASSSENELCSSSIKMLEALFSQSTELVKQMEIEVRKHSFTMYRHK